MKFPFGARPMFRGYVGFGKCDQFIVDVFLPKPGDQHCGQNTSKDPGLLSESKDIKVVLPKLDSISNLRFATWPFRTLGCKQLLIKKPSLRAFNSISRTCSILKPLTSVPPDEKNTVESMVGYLNFNTWIGSFVCRCHDMNNQLSTVYTNGFNEPWSEHQLIICSDK